MKAAAEVLAELPEVRFIEPANEPQLNREEGRITSSAVNLTEGVFAHRSYLGFENFGAMGQGVRVGVMSDSVRHLATVQASGDRRRPLHGTPRAFPYPTAAR